MAKLVLRENLPSIKMPCGGVEELEELGLSQEEGDLRDIATCSRHTDMNAGCARWDNCDRAYKGSRPQNEVYLEVKKDGLQRITHGPCFHVVGRELHALSNGGLVEVLAPEGTRYKGRGSVRRHPTPDPTCLACRSGTCTAYDSQEIEVDCPKFLEAAKHPDLTKFMRVQHSSRERTRLLRRANERRLLTDEPEPEERSKDRGRDQGREKSKGA